LHSHRIASHREHDRLRIVACSTAIGANSSLVVRYRAVFANHYIWGVFEVSEWIICMRYCHRHFVRRMTQQGSSRQEIRVHVGGSR
jgi:hypothetical protein